ncbi:MAG: AAA family ATPase [Anaerolineaceae bacterium]|nr:AAA family ATPase [Anaerolineaceae bacterium]
MASKCAYRLTTLVGREALLQDIRNKIDTAPLGPQIIFLSGDGGIGKTRVLEVLQKELDRENYFIPDEIIDFYQPKMHTATGLSARIYGTSSDEVKSCLDAYADARENLKIPRYAGDVGVDKLRQESLNAFINGIHKCSQKKRTVVFLDTAEQLVYSEKIFADVWNWILESIQRWGNVSLILAGRPGKTKTDLLFEQVQKKSISVHFHKIPELTIAGAKAYFGAVVKACEADGDFQLAERVINLSGTHQELAHKCSNGRPILLALLVDYLSVGEHPEVLETLRNQEELENILINRFIEDSEIGDMLRAMGRAPKGVDEDLLAKLLDISINEAAQKIKNICRFSFVKQPPHTDRWFLHDEMYSMLNKHIFNSPYDSFDEDDANIAIGDYYRDLLIAIKGELTWAYFALEEGDEKISLVDTLPEINDRRREALLELMYYQLRQDVVNGFQGFYRNACEVVAAMHIRLTAEMRSFLEDESVSEDVKLRREFIEAVLEAENIRRLWIEQKPSEAKEATLELNGKLISSTDDLVGVSVSLQNWEAYYQNIDLNDFEIAEKLLKDSIEKLNFVVQDAKEEKYLEDVKVWHAGIVYGYAWWLIGFLKRNQYMTKDAIASYQEAVRHFRNANIDIYLAGALNDLGYALCEEGNWHDAKPLVNEALEKRRALGSLVPVGRSLNTMGIIERYEGSYSTAIKYNEAALRVFKAANHKSGQGLALTALANSYQRLAYTVGDEGEIARINKIKYYRDAIGFSEEAVDTLREIGATRPMADALKELGCACRNLVHYKRKYPLLIEESLDELKGKSLTVLQEALSLADNDPYRKLEAEINIAYLGFYAGDEDLYNQSIAAAKKLVPEKYKIDDELQLEDQQMRLFWTQLGKLHMLQGRHALEVDDDFDGAIEYFAKGLECNNKYKDHYPGMQQAETHVYNILKVKRYKELLSVSKIVKKFEEEHNLQGRSFIRQRLSTRSLWVEEDD